MKTKHSESHRRRTPEYVAWINMKERCNNASLKAYKWYGGRGVKVCERWNASFESFLADVGRRPTPQHSLDRYPNRDGNYEPGNVRWATEVEQQRNRRSNVTIEVGGERLCIAEVAEKTGLKPRTISRRLSNGWTNGEAAGPLLELVRYEYKGRMLTVSEIARLEGIPINSMGRRLRRHGDPVTAVEAWRANRRGKRRPTVGEERNDHHRTDPDQRNLPCLSDRTDRVGQQ